VLRGKCADCRLPISVAYPLVELTTGCCLRQWRSVRRFGVLPAYLWFAGAGVALTLIDFAYDGCRTRSCCRRTPCLLVLLAGAAALGTRLVGGLGAR